LLAARSWGRRSWKRPVRTIKPIGEVEAPDKASAIKKALKELDVPANERDRLMAIRK
jgi:hypothetical protein